MRKTTDKRGHGLLGGVIVTVLVVGFVLLVLAAFLQALGPAIPFLGDLGLGLGILLVYIGAIAAVGIGVVVALYQRWKEVKGGEEDEAKNTEITFWPAFSTIYFAVIILTLLLEIVMGMFMGRFNPSNAGLDARSLLSMIQAFVLLVGLSVALWVRWHELRKTFIMRQLLGRRFLAALAVFGIIAAGPFWIPIHFITDNPFDWLFMYQVYLIITGLVLMVPCYLIYSLGKALGEKEMEKEEMDEAKKY